MNRNIPVNQASHSNDDLPQTRKIGPAQQDTISSEKIGHYQLLEKIGEGGFGSVWLAEQEEPVRRRVAVKLIKGASQQGSDRPL